MGVTVRRFHTPDFDVRDIAFDRRATLLVPARSVISRGHHGSEGHIRIDIPRRWHRHAALERVQCPHVGAFGITDRRTVGEDLGIVCDSGTRHRNRCDCPQQSHDDERDCGPD